MIPPLCRPYPSFVLILACVTVRIVKCRRLHTTDWMVFVEQIHEGSDTLWAGCGQTSDAFTAVSTGNVMTVRFKTDRDVQLTGFSARYSEVLTGTSQY